jgi:CRISPR-associated protein Csb2
MPTTIAIQFPWGRYHGTPWGRNVNEGVVDWPPEPWRLLRAFYATWRARAPELPDDVVSSLLDTLAEPPDYLVPPHRVAHTRHYYPDAKHGPKGGGTDKVFDTFAVMARNAELRVTWSATLEGPQRDALGVLCERLTYLGRADSVCMASLVTESGPDDMPPGHQRLRPAESHESGGPDRHGVLTAARPLQLDVLEARPQRLRKAGRIEPPGSRRVPYPVAGEAELVRERRQSTNPRTVTAVRLRITGKALPSPRASVAVAEALRQATLSRFDPEGSGRHSVALFGKDGDGLRVDTDHQHAHYLALTSSGAPHRMLDTLVVWAAGGLDESEIDALAAVPRLGGRRFIADFRPCRVAVEASGTVRDVAPELFGPSRRWRSLTPYAPPRNVRRQPTWLDHAVSYLQRDLERAGLPPVHIEPCHEQWLSFRRHRPGERLAQARRATGFTLEFDEQVEGPISVGALRHFGLGLFVPIDG